MKKNIGLIANSVAILSCIAHPVYLLKESKEFKEFIDSMEVASGKIDVTESNSLTSGLGSYGAESHLTKTQAHISIGWNDEHLFI